MAGTSEDLAFWPALGAWREDASLVSGCPGEALPAAPGPGAASLQPFLLPTPGLLGRGGVGLGLSSLFSSWSLDPSQRVKLCPCLGRVRCLQVHQWAWAPAGATASCARGSGLSCPAVAGGWSRPADLGSRSGGPAFLGTHCPWGGLSVPSHHQEGAYPRHRENPTCVRPTDAAPRTPTPQISSFPPPGRSAVQGFSPVSLWPGAVPWGLAGPDLPQGEGARISLVTSSRARPCMTALAQGSRGLAECREGSCPGSGSWSPQRATEAERVCRRAGGAPELSGVVTSGRAFSGPSCWPRLPRAAWSTWQVALGMGSCPGEKPSWLGPEPHAHRIQGEEWGSRLQREEAPRRRLLTPRAPLGGRRGSALS